MLTPGFLISVMDYHASAGRTQSFCFYRPVRSYLLMCLQITISNCYCDSLVFGSASQMVKSVVLLVLIGGKSYLCFCVTIAFFREIPGMCFFCNHIFNKNSNAFVVEAFLEKKVYEY